MLVVQAGRSLGLVVEALQLFLIHCGREGQHFERYPPAERYLFRLVDDAHTAAADFADQAEVAERAGRPRGVSPGRRHRDAARGRRAPQLRQHLHRRQQPPQTVGMFGMFADIGVDVDRVAVLQAIDDFLDQVGQR